MDQTIVTEDLDISAEEAYQQWAVRARALDRLRTTLGGTSVPLDCALTESIVRLERSVSIWWFEFLWACS